MTRLHIGGRVQVVSAIPGFHLQKGIVSAITEPFVSGEGAREEALRELRLYVVQLEDGRHFRFRGKELLPEENGDRSGTAHQWHRPVVTHSSER
jgi:hypothetical protein